MVDDETPTKPESLKGLLQAAALAKARAIEEHRALRESEPFVAQVKFLDRLVLDYVEGLRLCWTMATRSTELVTNSLVLRHIDESLQSVVAVRAMLVEGLLTAARREQRFMLEALVKYLYADQSLPLASFESRCAFLRDEVDRSSIDAVDHLRLHALEKADAQLFKSEVQATFRELCAYVHPSVRQIDERVRRDAIGEHVGFESVKTLESQTKELRRVLDQLLVIVFHGLGLGLAGDVFTVSLDGNPAWKFHRTKFVSRVSKHFDYKVERGTGR